VIVNNSININKTNN